MTNMALISEILEDFMKSEEIDTLAALANRLNLPFKDLDKYMSGKKTPSPSVGYKILKDISVSEETLDKFFKDTYGCGNSAYLQMMRGKLESDYARTNPQNI